MAKAQALLQKSARKRGRPSAYSPTLAQEICSRISSGESLRGVCRDRDMPDVTTVIRWTYSNDDFRQQYAHAREMQADLYFDSLLELAESATEKDAHVVRLRVDTLKWILARMRPGTYSERLQVHKQEEPVETHEDRMRRLWAEINVKVKIEEGRRQEIDVTPLKPLLEGKSVEADKSLTENAPQPTIKATGRP